MLEVSRVLITPFSDGSYSQLVTFTSKEEPTVRELKEEFSSSCHHEYDCCGCTIYKVDTSTLAKLDDSTYTVNINCTVNV